MTALEYLFQSAPFDAIKSSLYQIQGTTDDTCHFFLTPAHNLFYFAGINFVSPVIESTPTSLVHEAVRNSTFEKTFLKKILEADPNALNMKIKGQTPLHLFVETVCTYLYILVFA